MKDVKSISIKIISEITACLAILSIVFLFAPVVDANAGDNGSIAQELELIFSADFGDGEQIYASSYRNNGWTRPQQISNSGTTVFHPVIGYGPDLKKWAVWTQKENQKEFLYYTVHNGAEWGPGGKIDTKITHNRSASLIVDDSNIPWLAWEGAEKSYSDVFWSRWNGVEWEPPVKANADNDVPDVQPSLALDGNGRVTLSWQTFSDGKYVTAAEFLDRKEGRFEDHAVTNDTPIAPGHTQVRLPAIPSFIKEEHTAALFFKTDSGARAVPLSRF